MNGCILDNQALPVNREDFDVISLDQEDAASQYTIVPNALIRDKSLSPQCRWLIIYLISNKSSWTIKSRQLWEHTKGFIGRDGIRKILNEAIEAGYIERKEIYRETLKGKLRGYSYKVSSTPKFKKCLRETGFQGPDHQEPEFQGPDGQGIKEVLSKELLSKERLSKDSPSYKVSTETMAAEAAGVESGELLKKPKKKKEASHEVKELTGKMLTLLKDNVPVYRPPDDLAKFYEDVGHLIEKEEQNPEVLLKTFEWALQDTEKRGDFPGWQGIVAKNKRGRLNTSPAGIFRQHFTTIYAQMKSRPARKFAPGSDDDAALAAILEGKEGAL